ncbi:MULTISPECIES: hypothetical protein [unclassified Streptomyces]|uniref:hypothetical protein n=1 Tax=unclassified Streptomyces TaxID=2593676 RepID=UPI001BEBF357|nr:MULTISPECIES: hypothetical protein [unclassified Streptomyces]MBT2406853.1 hypothetical protein [Streptomyces sp. ISL-21]MBT2612970.1 hypothetical protein [Streptomyces sp. ISL-87]
MLKKLIAAMTSTRSEPLPPPAGPARRTAPAAATPVPAPVSRSTSPRPMASYELASWNCPTCEQTASEGTQAWDDRGPYQLLSVHNLRCPAGHRWNNSNDGS